MSRPHHLSKSRYLAGLQCHKYLWWRVHEPDAPELVPDERQQAVFDQGHQVGAAARARFPGGAMVDLPPRDFGARAARTRELMDAGAPAIFEASFLAGGGYSAVDVLERTRRGFRLIEVKSSTSVKDEHVPDVAFQLHVLRGAGVEIERAELMHLNRECVHPRLEDLFTRQDLTTAAEAQQPEVLAQAAAMRNALAGALPDVAPGPQCERPYPCPFHARCNPPRPEFHVSTLYRVPDGGRALLARGIETIADLPEDERLNAVQDRQRRAVRAGGPVVEPGLAEALAPVRGAIAFLDFETVQPAIPIWPGCHPYDQVPAQFSCHVLAADGSASHHEWLAEAATDPRRACAEAVVRACATAEVVVGYNVSFERGCLERLAEAAPEHAPRLAAIASRLFDLLPVVRNHVYHPGFAGSFGLKSVLPALVPGLGYEGLRIADGEAASIGLRRLLVDGEPADLFERETLRRDLLAYCERDTLATVRLLERLRALASG